MKWTQVWHAENFPLWVEGNDATPRMHRLRLLETRTVSLPWSVSNVLPLSVSSGNSHGE